MNHPADFVHIPEVPSQGSSLAHPIRVYEKLHSSKLPAQLAHLYTLQVLETAAHLFDLRYAVAAAFVPQCQY